MGLKLGNILSFGASRLGHEGSRGLRLMALFTLTCSFSPSETQTCLSGCQHQADTVIALPGLRESWREPVGNCQGWGVVGLGLAPSSHLSWHHPPRKTEQWPQKLIMQLIPQQLLVSGGGGQPCCRAALTLLSLPCSLPYPYSLPRVPTSLAHTNMPADFCVSRRPPWALCSGTQGWSSSISPTRTWSLSKASTASWAMAS